MALPIPVFFPLRIWRPRSTGRHEGLADRQRQNPRTTMNNTNAGKNDGGEAVLRSGRNRLSCRWQLDLNEYLGLGTMYIGSIGHLGKHGEKKARTVRLQRLSWGTRWHGGGGGPTRNPRRPAAEISASSGPGSRWPRASKRGKPSCREASTRVLSCARKIAGFMTRPQSDASSDLEFLTGSRYESTDTKLRFPLSQKAQHVRAGGGVSTSFGVGTRHRCRDDFDGSPAPSDTWSCRSARVGEGSFSLRAHECS